MSLADLARFVLVPSNFLFLLGLAGLGLLMFRRLALGRALVALSMGGFLIFGYTSAGELLLAPLERRFETAVDIAEAPEPFGIVVIGSQVSEVYSQATGSPVEFGDGAETVFATVLLARRFPEARIIVSAGHGGGFPPEPLREADGMKRLLVLYGIAEDRIAVEGTSASTYERVAMSLDLMGEDRDETWWVVTSAMRVPRTVALFRAAGVRAVPYPVDFRWIPPFDPTYFYELTYGLSMTDRAVHEWIGLAYYRLSGKTAEFFPAPCRPGPARDADC